MAAYSVGKHTTRQRKRTTCNIHLTVKPAVFARLEAMRDALQREIGPAHEVTIASIVRRILYQHSALHKLAMRHYSPPEASDNDDMRVM